MKTAVLKFWYLALNWIALPMLMAAPPANDRFENRTRVEGTLVEMRGTFSEATAEAGEPRTCCGDNSLWWSWTAPESGLVLLETRERYPDGTVYVTTATNLGSITASDQLVTTMLMGFNRYAAFQAEAGKEYQIGVFGNSQLDSRLPFEVRLSMTTLPVILSGPGPVTQTISPGAGALFTVAVARVEGNTTQIQWQFDGVDLPNENRPMLVRTNATVSLAGEYRAIVRNIDPVGNVMVKTSHVARLMVSPPESPRMVVSPDPQDKAMLLVSVSGQPGRWYGFKGFESFEPQSFPVMGWHMGREMFSAEFPRQILADRSHAFFQVTVFEPRCLNLQCILFAKDRIGADRKIPRGATVAVSEIQDWMGYVPECPEGGTYSYGVMGAYPTCNVARHFIP